MARMMGQDNIKPCNTRQTLGPLARYFKPFWYALLVVAVLLVSSTWSQVRSLSPSAEQLTAIWSSLRQRQVRLERLFRPSLTALRSPGNSGVPSRANPKG